MLQHQAETSSGLKKLTFGVLSTAHLINDMYSNFIQQLVPFLVAGRILSVSAGATLVAVFTITSSLTQPIFGYLVDQKGQRWLLYVGTVWMSVLLGMTGHIDNYYLLLFVSGLSGMGTAAFHPQAAGMIGDIKSNRRGFLMAAFTAMGTLGMAISPLALLPLFHHFGIKATWVAIIPGVAAALILYFFAPRSSHSSSQKPELGQVLATMKKSWPELTKIMSVVAIRSLVNTGMLTLLPLYLLSRNFSPEVTGSLMFLTLGTGAVGGLIGGYISDRYGRKSLIVGSLVLTPPFFYGFLYTSGIPSFIFLALGGMMLLSSFSVTVAATQEIVPENKSLASGLSMGFSIGIGGLAISPIGRYADIYGVSAAVNLIFIFPFLAALLGLTLKGNKHNSTPKIQRHM